MTHAGKPALCLLCCRNWFYTTSLPGPKTYECTRQSGIFPASTFVFPQCASVALEEEAAFGARGMCWDFFSGRQLGLCWMALTCWKDVTFIKAPQLPFCEVVAVSQEEMHGIQTVQPVWLEQSVRAGLGGQGLPPLGRALGWHISLQVNLKGNVELGSLESVQLCSGVWLGKRRKGQSTLLFSCFHSETRGLPKLRASQLCEWKHLFMQWTSGTSQQGRPGSSPSFYCLESFLSFFSALRRWVPAGSTICSWWLFQRCSSCGCSGSGMQSEFIW